MRRSRLVKSVLSAVVALAALAGCEARQIVSAGSSTGCTLCHGGQDNATGAPPLDASGATTTTARGVGAHTAHVRAGLDCTACHVKPASKDHSDQRVTLTWGALATAGGALSPQLVAGGGGAVACASVYCHGSFTGGNGANAPLWNGALPGQAACGTCHGSTAGTAAPTSSHPALAAGSTNATCAACHPETVDAAGALRAGGKHVNGAFDTDAAARHPAGWTSPGSSGWHGLAAAADPARCNRCHAVRRPAAVTDVTCADCHLGGQSWTTTCNGCHGEPADPRGAPPADVAGRSATTELGVGAHRRHVDASATSAGLDCVFCHRKPADAYDAGHLDGAVTITAYTGSDAAWIAAGRDPGWSRATATCATSYCHSAYAPANVPVWTAPRASACGTCHGLPPAGPHPPVAGDLTACSACHPDTMTAAGALIAPPAGKHLDGHVSVMSGHVSGWMDPSSPEFHAYAADRGLASCQGCHGADLTGGFTTVACGRCHDAAGASWRTRCVMCHGGGAGDTAGAPPRTIWGYGADAVRVGAHRAHLAGGALGRPIACGTCHVVPAEALSAGHVDTVSGPSQPRASVVFSGVAAAGAAPAWDRAGRGCSVYCHGSSFVGTASEGSRPVPDWTGGPSQAACGSCHGAPPGGTHPRRLECGGCHPGYGAGTVNLETHVNGILEPPVLGCSSCHGDAGRAATPRNPQIAVAPPWGTDGELATTARSVGAHQLHLAAGSITDGIACAECHAPVTSLGHRSGAVELEWGPLATTSVAAGAISWDGARCAGTYCHGNFRYGTSTNAPAWTAPAARACGTCHGLPPASPHPSNTRCGGCHDGYGNAVPGAPPPAVDKQAHLNGRPDVRTDCDSCHGERARTPIVPACGTGLCTDPLVRAAPPAGADGELATTAAAVGAHEAHVNRASFTAPVRCAECHLDAVPPASPAHMNGSADVRLAGRATLGADAAGAAYDGSGCSATYCHGNYSGVYVYSWYDYGAEEVVTTAVAYQGARASPRWAAEGQPLMTCASCHGAPPSYVTTGAWHSPDHGNQPSHRECQTCHPDATSAGGVPTGISNPLLHVNGAVDVTPQFRTGCSCHGF